MANVKISALPAAIGINPNLDVMPLVTNSGTVTSKATTGSVVNAVLAATPVPSIGAVASGTLATGDTVILNSDGTVTAVTGTASTIGASTAFGAGTIKNLQGLTTVSGYIVVVYQETVNHYIQISVGTLAGTTITFNDTETIDTGDLDDLTFPTVGLYAGTNIVWVTYSPTSNNELYAVGAEVTSSVITLGTPVLVDSTYTTSQAVAASIYFNQPCIIYQTTDGGVRGVTFTMSGPTISGMQTPSIELSSSTTTQICLQNYANSLLITFFQEGTTAAVNFCQYLGPSTLYSVGTAPVPGLDLSQNTFSSTLTGNDLDLLVAFAEATTGVLDAIVLEIDTDTFGITLGNSQTIDSSPATGYGAISTYKYPNGTIGIFYNSQALDNLKVTTIQIDSITTIKIDGVTILAQGANPSYMWRFPTSNALQNAVFYYNGAQQYLMYTAATTNLTDRNFIGYSYSNYTDGQTAIIRTLGSTITGLTGLTPGLQYYVTETGDLSLTPGIPAINAGTGISTTSLLFNA